MMPPTTLAQGLGRLQPETDIVVFFAIGLMKAVRAMAEELDRRNDPEWRAALQARLEQSVKQDASFPPMAPENEMLCYDAVLAGIEEALSREEPAKIN